MKAKKKPEELRSFSWFGPDTLRGFSHRSRMLQLGFQREDFIGKPVIAIINTWSEINPCHAHLRERAEAVKRGVWQAGGFPVEVPAITITETYMKPSPMMYRNMLAMDTEEALRSLPIDAAVLMGGCDKTTPALLMGAISANVPAIYLPAGPMLRGNWDGKMLGSGTDVWKFWADRCAGVVSDAEWRGVEIGIARSPGFCMTMGTASTMTALAEALGMTLPGASSIPAADSNHVRLAMDSGRRAVAMAWEDLKPSDIFTPAAFRNAITVDMAIGGSTNAIIHLVALARRCGFDLPLPRFDEISRNVPVLANIRPSGEYLMEDFYYAGGLRALMAEIRDLLDLDCLTVNGKTIGQNLEGAVALNRRCNPRALETAHGNRRHGDPVRIARSRWRRHQIRGRGPEPLDSTPGRRSSSKTSKIWRRASITKILSSMRIPFSSFRMRGRSVLPACRSGGCFQFRTRC